MEKVEKALKKLSDKEKTAVGRIIEKLIALQWIGLDVAKLKGTADVYRVRIGKIRIIYKFHERKITILAIERRSEKTYRNY